MPSHRRAKTQTRKKRLLRLEILERRHLLATFVVNSESDTGDSFAGDDICDTANDPFSDPPTPPSGECTLRAALQQTLGRGGGDTILFDVPGDFDFIPEIPGDLGIADDVIVDATSQASGQVIIQGPLNIFGDRVTLKGVFVQDMLQIGTNDNTVQGVVAETLRVGGDRNQLGGLGFDDAVVVLAGGLDLIGNENILEGSFVGFDPATGGPDANPGATAIRIVGTGNRIGGDELGAGNTIGGFAIGIELTSEDPNVPLVGAANVVQGNIIGIAPDGSPLPNTLAGVQIASVTGNRIGGVEFGEGNVISNSNIGVELLQDANDNLIQGNFIGTTEDGAAATDAQQIGILLNSVGDALRAPNSNTIGGSDFGAGNLISGNIDFGIQLLDGPHDNIIDGNIIGLDIGGDLAIGNGVGIEIIDAPENVIGGEEGNTISANIVGVRIAGPLASDNALLGNRIGTNADGSIERGNNEGVVIIEAPDTVIGGPLPGTQTPVFGNLISGSLPLPEQGLPGHGVVIAGAGAIGTTLHGNRIGTNGAGGAAISNAGNGVHIVDASGVRVGGDGAGRGNLISGNGGHGIFATTSPGTFIIDTSIEGNQIGTNLAGSTALANGMRGIHLEGDIRTAVIGGEAAGQRNLISGNGSDGVGLVGEGVVDTEVIGNTIGTNLDRSSEVANVGHGVAIIGASGSIIGKRGDTNVAGNTIAGNTMSGVHIEGATATGNILVGNRIGIGNDNEQLGNGDDGVSIVDAPGNRIGPYSNGLLEDFPQDANIISDNFDAGVRIQGAGASGNQILANGIGTQLGGNESPLLVWGNLESGVAIIDAVNNFIGAQPPVAIPAGATIPETVRGNKIIDNRQDGVQVTGASATGNRIQNNSIYLNREQGIDLRGDGITENDVPLLPGVPDVDTGPNLLQNFPVIDQLLTSVDKQTVRLASHLDSTPNQTYTVQVFSNFKKETTGQGRILLKTMDVAVGPSGIANFNVDVPAPQPDDSMGGRRASFFSMTATDPSGNTSEFSPAATAPELVLEDLDFTLSNIHFENGEFIFRDQIVVRNEGGRDVENVAIIFRDQDDNPLGPIDPDTTVDLPASENEPIDVMVDIEWDISSLILNAGGVKNLSLTATLDPENEFSELVDEVDNNQQSQSLQVDIRPVINASDVKTEYKPGAFLAGVNLENQIVLNAIDWNGNLPGDDLDGISKEIILDAGSHSESVLILGQSTPPFEFAFDLGEDLSPGTTRVTLTATALGNVPATVFGIDYTQVNNPEWIGDVFVSVSDVNPGPFDKVAKYHAGFGFPGFATDGFFELPLSVKIGPGALGPKIGSYELDLDFRSDGVAKLTGKAPWSGKIAGKQVLPEVKVELSGTLRPQVDELKLIKASTTVILEGDTETPAVPLPPPVSFLRAFGEISGELSATLNIEEQADGSLDWAPAGFGIGVGAALKIAAGKKGLAYAAGGVGGKIAAGFNLPAEPCLLDELTLQFALLADVQVLVAKAQFEFSFPDPPFMLAGCGGEAASLPGAEGENGSPPALTLALSTAGDHFATLTDEGMPNVQYRFAAPTLARHSNGDLTLLWVDEDPAKPTEGQLEIVASRRVDGVWSQPVALTDNSRLDVQPSVALMPDGTPVAVWNHVGDPITDLINPDPYAVLGSMDLFYSTFDLNSETWSAPAAIGSLAGMDYLPQVFSTPTGVAAAYLHDADGDTSLFPDDGKTTDSELKLVEFDGTGWSAAESVATGIDSPVAPEVVTGPLGGDVDGLAVWDKPPLGGSGGLRVAISRAGVWSSEVLLADEPDASSPQVARIPGSSNAAVVWMNEQISDGPNPEDTVDALYFASFADGTLGAKELIHKKAGISEPEISVDDAGRVAVSWIETFADGVGIGYALRDADGSWGQPGRFDSPTDQLPWWVLPYLEGDTLHTVHIARQIGFADPPAEGEDSDGATPLLGESALAFGSAQLGPDLNVSGLSIVESSPGVYDVSAVVANIGDLPSGATSAQLLNNGTSEGDPVAIAPMAPGESVQVDFQWTAPASPITPHVLGVIVDPGDSVTESDESNNLIEQSVLLPNLTIASLTSSIVGDAIEVSATILSNGDVPSGIDVVVDLILDDPETGQVIASTTIGALDVGESVAVNFTIDDARATLGGARIGFVRVDTLDELTETTESFDNQEIVSLNPYLSWTNPDDRFDIGNNGIRTPLDALLILNEINRNGSRRLPVPPTPAPFYDPSGDGQITPLDALQVLNQVARDLSVAASEAAVEQLQEFVESQRETLAAQEIVPASQCGPKLPDDDDTSGGEASPQVLDAETADLVIVEVTSLIVAELSSDEDNAEPVDESNDEDSGRLDAEGLRDELM